MRYYERWFENLPPGAEEDKETKQIFHPNMIAIEKIIYKKKILYHCLLAEEEKNNFPGALRVKEIAKKYGWKKQPHVFGPGQKPELDQALDEDNYAKEVIFQNEL